MEINGLSRQKTPDSFVFFTEIHRAVPECRFSRRVCAERLHFHAFCGILLRNTPDIITLRSEVEKTKRLITLLLAVLCALALCVPAFAADATVITDMKTDCLVDASGSCQITQTVTIDIAGTEDTIELPLAANAKKISVAGYKYKKDDAGRLHGARSLLQRRLLPAAGPLPFSYTVSGLVTEQDKIQTLTLPLLAHQSGTGRSTTTILPSPFPPPLRATRTFTSGYYGDVIEDYMSFTVRDGMIGGTVTTALQATMSRSP